MAEALSPSKIEILGILNTTPDSFYDGGKFTSLEKALARAQALLAEGTDWLDIGGESTRPGSKPIPAEQEIGRTLPVIQGILKKFPHARISIDTQKSQVARAAIEAGAEMINDVSAFESDPQMLGLLLQKKPWVVLMHMKGTPERMQTLAKYKNVVREVHAYLLSRAKLLISKGFPKNKIVLDPGLGFGKTLTHNLQILYNVRTLARSPFPLMIGASRKSFIGRILGSEDRPRGPEERLEGSLACALWAAEAGAKFLRVHDVLATKQALLVWDAIKKGGKKIS